MFNKLKQILHNGKLCEIYADFNNIDKFMVGYIKDMDDDFCLILCVNFYGEFDGIVCLAHDQIFKVQTDTRYLKAIENLMEHRKEYDFSTNAQGSILQLFMQEVAEKKRVCRIELCESDAALMFCTIDNIDLQGGIVNFTALDEYGIADGEAYADITAISLIEFDSLDTKRIEKLRTNKFAFEP